MFKQYKIHKIILSDQKFMSFSSPFFSLILPLMPFTLKMQSAVAFMRADVILPSRQLMSTTSPPSAHSPLTWPVLHWLGNAGRNSMKPS